MVGVHFSGSYGVVFGGGLVGGTSGTMPNNNIPIAGNTFFRSTQLGDPRWFEAAIPDARFVVEGTLSPVPEPTSITIDISGGDIQECISPEGNAVLLTADIILGPDAVRDTIQWSIDGNFAGNGDTIMPLLGLGTHTIEVTMTTINGVSSTFTDTASVEIEDTTAPVIFVSFVDRRSGEAVTQIDKANVQWIIASYEAFDVCDIDPVTEGNGGFPIASDDQLKIMGELGNIVLTVPVLELFVTSTDISENTASDTATLEFIE